MQRFVYGYAFASAGLVNGYIAGKTYPPFCSTTHDHGKRSIPVLMETTPLTISHIDLNLKHVTVITSEGTKTPSDLHQCWPDYDDAAVDTSSWDCSLNTMNSPPSIDAINYLNIQDKEYGEANSSPNVKDEVTSRSGAIPSFLYEKQYDANYSPSGSDHFPSNIGNRLGGTCQLGQLTLRGYEQHRQNGIHLRNAYVKSDIAVLNVNKEPRHILFDFDDEVIKTVVHQRAYDEPSLYFRSDDKQATMMSGQALLQSLFGDLMSAHADLGDGKLNPVIRVHTSDGDRDVLEPNSEMCPALAEIEKEATKSANYAVNFLRSNEARMMMELADDFMGGYYRVDDPRVAMDCLMTAVCSDRSVPYVLNYDESKDDETLKNRFGDDWFNRFVEFVSQTICKEMTYPSTLLRGRSPHLTVFAYSIPEENPIFTSILISGTLKSSAIRYGTTS